MPSRTRTPTLWELGRHPGRLVVRFSVVLGAAATGASLLAVDRLALPFDLVFVALCVAGPLWVRPRDFYIVGVLPPALLGGTVLVLALTAPETVARPGDSVVQAVVSGLAHHGVPLAVGYSLTLLLIGLRQVALRNDGVIRVRAIRAAVVDERLPVVEQRRPVVEDQQPSVVEEQQPSVVEEQPEPAEAASRNHP